MSESHSLSQLVEIMTPPTTPVRNTGNWSTLENQLGITFPETYKRFISRYGSGVICDYVYIHNYFDIGENDPKERIGQFIAPIEEFRDRFIFPLYPEVNGFLPIAHTDNCSLFLAREVDGQDEIVISCDHYSEYVMFQDSIITFLLALNSNRDGIKKEVPISTDWLAGGLTFKSINFFA